MVRRNIYKIQKYHKSQWQFLGIFVRKVFEKNEILGSKE